VRPFEVEFLKPSLVSTVLDVKVEHLHAFSLP
jgi:hypothetical protein